MNENILSMEERECLYFLQSVEGLGNAGIRKLKEKYSSYGEIYRANARELMQLLTPSQYAAFSEAKSRIYMPKNLERLRELRIRQIAYGDKEYPAKLKNIPDPPLALYVKGSLPREDIPTVAVVGARRNTPYGYAMAREFSSVLARAGVQVVSGMARGIDSAAMNAALKCGGYSCGVLGCGVDVCYPPQNRELYDRLTGLGGLISEYVPGSKPLAWHFPIRNRIISGLCDALLVIEAATKSGTMITVDTALEQGREVYALPGRIDDEMSKGCNELIRQGAGILTSPEDFLAQLMSHIAGKDDYSDYLKKWAAVGSSVSMQLAFVPTTPQERAIYKALDYNPRGLDLILNKVNEEIPMPLPNLMQWLTNMTISGYVGCVAGNNYYKLR